MQNLSLNATLKILGYTTQDFANSMGRKRWFRNGRYVGSFSAGEGWAIIERGTRKFNALRGAV